MSASTAERFRSAFRNHPSGVAVVTADPGGGPVGLTASSVISVSAEPAIVVFSLSNRSSATRELLRADSLVIHMLGADQLALAKTFATSGVDRFADVETWYRLRSGEPVLHAAPTWLRGDIASRVQAGESTVVVLDVAEIQTPDPDDDELRPLVYHNRRWHTLGRETVVA